MKKNKKVTIKRKKTTRSKLEINGKLIINVLLIVILLLGASYMYAMANTIDIENKNLLISYAEESDVTYDVALKPNNYYQTTVLGMNQQYPSLLIDKINIKMNYKFLTSEEGKYKYRYFATTTLIADHKTNDISIKNNNLLTQTYQLDNIASTEEITSKEYSLKKEYSIDYNYYNNYINEYKNAYNLSLNSYLKVTMYVELIDTYHNNVINTTRTMDVTIPLLNNPVNISVNNPPNINKSIYHRTSEVTNSTFFIVLASLMLVAGILLAIQEFKKVIKSDKQQSKYINKLNKIMSANSEVIVKVTNQINLKNNNIIEVESIEELLDAQNELRIPIAYFETKRNKEGCFVIVNGKEAWRYILRIEEDK